ncbi:MAG: GNAT family N-acetyltransferase [Chloroflexi bacterium]|nr:GNAT family N-acetyltransferase [Chloroflexota bacterium]
MHKMLIDLPDQLETERLILRPYRAGDGAAYYEVCQRNKDHLLPYEAGNPALSVNTPAQAEILMRNFAADWAARNAFFWGAWDKTSEAFTAQIYAGPVDWELPEFEIGYFVDRDHEGQGYVTEAVRAVLAWLFEGMGTHRVRLACNEMNVRSWRVAERCGFVREGHLRQTRKLVLRADGSYSGDYLYGLLRHEFENLNH